jgi:hypothetical protein
MPRPIVPPAPGQPGKPINAIERLGEFLLLNNGVMVTYVEDVGWVCQGRGCGSSAPFASLIAHSSACVYDQAQTFDRERNSGEAQ